MAHRQRPCGFLRWRPGHGSSPAAFRVGSAAYAGVGPPSARHPAASVPARGSPATRTYPRVAEMQFRFCCYRTLKVKNCQRRVVGQFEIHRIKS